MKAKTLLDVLKDQTDRLLDHIQTETPQGQESKAPVPPAKRRDKPHRQQAIQIAPAH